MSFRTKMLARLRERPETWTLRDFKRKGDYPEILLLENDGPTLQRTLPRHKRASVLATSKGNMSCVFPHFWYMEGTQKNFGCALCPEQDVCPLHKKRYSKNALRLRKGATDSNSQVAMKYHGIKTRQTHEPEEGLLAKLKIGKEKNG